MRNTTVAAIAAAVMVHQELQAVLIGRSQSSIIPSERIAARLLLSGEHVTLPQLL